jgi:hypothetical protein
MAAHDAIEAGLEVGGSDAPARFRQWWRWRFNRLRCMSPAEVLHRAIRALSTRAECAGLLGPAEVPRPDLGTAPGSWIRATAGIDAARYLAAADRIEAGKLDVFALRAIDFSSPRWNRDPRTGIEAPLGFGMLLDYRDSRQVGNIKYLWEINRHPHLVTLAQAYALSGDVRYFSVIRRHLESWFAACPHRVGPNWSSALEAAIRMINWAIAWQLLGGAAAPLFANAGGAQFRQRWLESAYQHAEFVRGHFSGFSSANNHLIGEAAGLFIAALIWPHWPRTRAWLDESKSILEREALAQNAADGVNREQAVCYQQFVLDFLVLALLAGQANRLEFSTAFESRIESMLEYLASIIDAGGSVPMFGDSDDGRAAGLAPDGENCPYRSLLATGAILFGRGDFKAKAGGLDDKTRWLVGAGADSAFARLDSAGAKLPVRRAFPEGGYYILGCDFETCNEIRLVADVGSLGYREIAAHGHADALSFTLSVGGEEFLIDPGTYAYHAGGPWRAYFRGTSAHNTLCVDGKDQSQSGGNFMWLRKARAGCSHWSSTPERDLLEGWQDGYMRLADPVLHRRRISLDKKARCVTIEDILEMDGEHEIELAYHCSEQCRAEAISGGYRLCREGRALRLTLPRARGATARVHHGSLAPIAGWVSRTFDDKQPAATVRWSARLRGECVLRTQIDC